MKNGKYYIVSIVTVISFSLLLVFLKEKMTFGLSGEASDPLVSETISDFYNSVTDFNFAEKTDSAITVSEPENKKNDEKIEKVFYEKDEIRAIWVPSVFNLGLPSKSGLSKNDLKKEADELIGKVKSNDLNAIFFQVRPTSDALYESSIFPSSHYLTGEEGKSIEFDILDYLIYKCHKEGILIYAWVNPYRVTTSGKDYYDLSENNPARVHPEWTYKVDGRIYYNPAKSEVIDLIADGIYELCFNYSVDGVIFDDYFYPENINLEDYDDYLEYSNGESLGDFRRNNVNRLIEKCASKVKSVSQRIAFGVSPHGIWRNSSIDRRGSATNGFSAYDEIYCDALAWLENGYIDFISPQIYWDFETENARFDILADFWNREVSRYGKAKLIVSLAKYRFDDDEIEKEIDYLKELDSYSGYALYSSPYLE